MLAKILFSATGFLVYWANPSISPYFAAFSIAILPIWAEVAVCWITKVEPAREKSRVKLRIDAAIDATCFLALPCLWFLHWSLTPSVYLVAALAIFFFAGIYRLLQFLKNGLNSDGKFSGLPLTYTGYMWIVLVFIENNLILPLDIILLLSLAFLMLYSKLKIPASR